MLSLETIRKEALESCLVREVSKAERSLMGVEAEELCSKLYKALPPAAKIPVSLVSATHAIEVRVFHYGKAGRKIHLTGKEIAEKRAYLETSGLKSKLVRVEFKADGAILVHEADEFKYTSPEKMRLVGTYKRRRFLDKPDTVKPLPSPKVPVTVPKPKPSEVKDVILTEAQKSALQYVSSVGELTSSRVKILADKLKISEEDVIKLSKIVSEQVGSDTMPLCMNRSLSLGSRSYVDVMENGVFKNQFQLGTEATSSGALGPYKGSSRDRWEKILYGDSLHKGDYMNIASGGSLPSKLAEERPLYGFLYDRDNSGLASNYGEVTFVMKKEVANRVTLTTGNSSFCALREFMSDGRAMTKDSNYGMLYRMAENAEEEKGHSFIEDILSGRSTVSSHSRGGTYTEAQFHGGIRLDRDVKEIVIPYELEHIKALGKKWNIPVRIDKQFQWK